jgi:hypothetical protein
VGSKTRSLQTRETLTQGCPSIIKRERESFLEKEFKNSAVTYTDAVRIHNLATPEEKPLLDRLLRIRRANQLRNHGVSVVQKAEAAARE